MKLSRCGLKLMKLTELPLSLSQLELPRSLVPRPHVAFREITHLHTNQCDDFTHGQYTLQKSGRSQTFNEKLELHYSINHVNLSHEY